MKSFVRGALDVSRGCAKRNRTVQNDFVDESLVKEMWRNAITNLIKSNME